MKISPFTFQTEFGLAPDHSAGPWGGVGVDGFGGPAPRGPAEKTCTTRRALHAARASPLAIIAGTHGDMTVGRDGVWMYSGCYSLLKDLNHWGMIGPFDVS